MRKYLCPTPHIHCNGGALGQASFSIRHKPKAHGSPVEAFKCYRRYLVNVVGCERVGPRELRHPKGSCICGWNGPKNLEICPSCNRWIGVVEVLTKPSRFGAVLRRGKGGEQGGSRVMPALRPGGTIAG